jgi:hypothetical protein
VRRTLAALLLAAAPAAAQDFQVGSRAKGMGGSYTAFGDDPVAVWCNPAGTAQQASQFAITFQSFTQYEFDSFSDPLPPVSVGEPEQGLLDPPISPSFAGVVYQAGDADLEMAVSLAYIRPFQIKYVYLYDDPDPLAPDLLSQTDQQFSRIRTAFGISFKLREGNGFLTRLALGAAVDFVHTKYREIDQDPDPAADTQTYEDSESTAGIGAGLLATLVQSDAFQLDLGAAWNSEADFDFDLDKRIFPVWDWPALASAGLAVYLGEGYPFRLTVDAQWIAWEDAVGDPAPGLEGFDDTLSFSAGAEYRFTLRPSLWLFVRSGFKSYDTPWGSESKLPALGQSRLTIETEGDRIEIFTAGLGLYWARKSADGQSRVSGIDLAVELFGETTYLMAVGFNYQFD